MGREDVLFLGLLLIAWSTESYSAEPHSRTIAPYSWQAGGYYSFVTEATVSYEGVERELTGTVLYQLHSVKEGEPAKVLVEDSEGTGTAFVVASDGYLLTCHHVVEDATEITVHLGGKVFPAKVLGSEPDCDLAVLKIQASNLPSLSLAYEGECELGMDLRAVGYPLSDMLGESLKVTEGVLTGIARYDGKRFYQTDAEINAGSRGGPVVNTKGEVVGLAGVSLSGQGISEVNLAVPRIPGGGDSHSALRAVFGGWGGQGTRRPRVGSPRGARCCPDQDKD